MSEFVQCSKSAGRSSSIFYLHHLKHGGKLDFLIHVVREVKVFWGPCVFLPSLAALSFNADNISELLVLASLFLSVVPI